MFFISNIQFGQPPTATTCAETRDLWGLTMPVVYDPTGQLNTDFSMAINGSYLVMETGGVITKTGQHPNNTSLSADIQAALNP